MTLHGAGYIRFRIYRFQSHEPGQSADAFDIDIVSQRTKVLMQAPYPVIGSARALLIQEPHQDQIVLALRTRLVIISRPLEAEQIALPLNAEI